MLICASDAEVDAGSPARPNGTLNSNEYALMHAIEERMPERATFGSGVEIRFEGSGWDGVEPSRIFAQLKRRGIIGQVTFADGAFRVTSGPQAKPAISWKGRGPKSISLVAGDGTIQICARECSAVGLFPPVRDRAQRWVVDEGSYYPPFSLSAPHGVDVPISYFPFIESGLGGTKHTRFRRVGL